MWLNILWDYVESKCIAALKVIFTHKPASLHLNWCFMIILNNQIHSQNVPPDTFKCRSKILIFFACSVQSLSHVRLFATPWIAARQASLSNTNSRSSPRFTSIESVLPSNHLILCRPLLLLPPIPPSIRVFSNESTLRMRWPKYWSFSFSIIPSKEIPGLIFRMDWLDLLVAKYNSKCLKQTSSILIELWIYLGLFGTIFISSEVISSYDTSKCFFICFQRWQMIAMIT